MGGGVYVVGRTGGGGCSGLGLAGAVLGGLSAVVSRLQAGRVLCCTETKCWQTRRDE